MYNQTLRPKPLQEWVAWLVRMASTKSSPLYALGRGIQAMRASSTHDQLIERSLERAAADLNVSELGPTVFGNNM